MRKLLLAIGAALAAGCARDANTTLTIECPVGAAYCANACSNLSADPSNCGACGHACGAGESCRAGSCTTVVPACGSGLSPCDGACVDLASDRADCGACGHVCDIHQACTGGRCVLECQADLVVCGTVCVDVATDGRNCGGCDLACAPGVACVAGVCGGSSGGGGSGGCAAGLLPCGGGCVDPATDVHNCGTCGHACLSTSTCQGGTCTATCGGALVACGEACVDTQNDLANCGGCGIACQPGQSCNSGACECPAGLDACGATTGCVDLAADPANCGACGHACANGEACTGGTCACAAGSAACAPGTACIDLATDADNCGTCGSACPVGQTCVGGACAADATAFRMLGADARHSGLNTGETGTPPLQAAWVAKGAGGSGPPVVEGGRVFALSGARLHALEASNGAEIWSYNFGQILGGIGWPAVSDGAVYVATSNNYADTWLRRFDRATGEVEFKVPFGSQWERYWSPVISGGAVFLDGGTYGGLYGFDAAAGGQRFYAALEQYDEWSPAVFGDAVYTFVDGIVRAHDPASGTVRASHDFGWTWNGWSMRTAPVFGDAYGYVISPPNLHAFAPGTCEPVWSVNDNFVSYAAVGGGNVYALSSGTLHALDATTGARKWMFAGDDALAYPPVMAAGYLYVSSPSNVYAVDPATHQAVWSAPVGGPLAIGSGMLFVSRPSDGSLVAFRLTR